VQTHCLQLLSKPNALIHVFVLIALCFQIQKDLQLHSIMEDMKSPNPEDQQSYLQVVSPTFSLLHSSIEGYLMPESMGYQ
jgi:hypothetical protein